MKPACRGEICSADEDGSRLRFMARQSRFIIRRIASCTGGAIHKSAFSDETAPFHSAMKHFRFRSNMKHSAYAAYDEKMKNKSFCLQYMPCAVILPLEIKFLFGKKLQKNRFFTKNKSDIPARLLYYQYKEIANCDKS